MVDAEVFVCSALDEVAWLLNIRGADIPFNPVVISYVILHKTSGLVQWYIDADKVQPALMEQLSEEAAPYKVALRPYGAILEDLKQMVDTSACRVLIPLSSSLALHEVVPEAQKVAVKSPVCLPKVCSCTSNSQLARRACIQQSLLYSL